MFFSLTLSRETAYSKADSLSGSPQALFYEGRPKAVRQVLA